MLRGERDSVACVFEVVARNDGNGTVFRDRGETHRIVVARAQQKILLRFRLQAEDCLFVQFEFAAFLRMTPTTDANRESGHAVVRALHLERVRNSIHAASNKDAALVQKRQAAARSGERHLGHDRRPHFFVPLDAVESLRDVRGEQHMIVLLPRNHAQHVALMDRRDAALLLERGTLDGRRVHAGLKALE